MHVTCTIFCFFYTYLCTAFRDKTPRVEALYSLRTGSVMQQKSSKALLGGSRFSRLTGDCSGFLNQGCKQVPLEYTRGIVRWAHPDGYFLNAQGHKMAHKFGPAMQFAIQKDRKRRTGKLYPVLDVGVNKACHILMALAFYGDRPTDPLTGKPCVCHHLIPDPLDYRPANLLCWLTRAEHTEADRRQRALRKVVPDGDLHVFDYQYLRTLQDPRVTDRANFECILSFIAQQHFHRDNFATNPPAGLTPFDARMERDMTHHMEH